MTREAPAMRYISGECRASRKLSRLVTGSRLADTNFYACFSRGRIRLQADVIVNRIAKTLLAAQVSLRRLN